MENNEFLYVPIENTSEGIVRYISESEDNVAGVLRIRHHKDIEGSIQTPLTNCATGQIEYMQRGEGEVQGSLIPRLPSTIEGSIVARRKDLSQIDSDITVSVDDDSYIKGSIRSAKISDLDSTVQIPLTNCATGIYSIYGSDGGSDLSGSLHPRPFKGLDSYLIVAPGNKMTGKVTTIGVKWNDLQGSILPRQVNDITSTLSVRPGNKMTGIVEVMQPYTETVCFEPTKDAMIRSDIPRLNYGNESDFAVGTSYGGDVFRALLQYDINTIPDDMFIKSAKIVLHHSLNVYSNQQLGVYDVSEEWNEYGVNWTNQPTTKGKVSEFNSGASRGSVEVDVRDIVTEWYKGDRENKGLLIKALDESLTVRTNYYSRESFLPPVLCIEYFDPYIASYARTEVGGSIQVRTKGNSDLPSYLDVIGYHDFTDVRSSVEIVTKFTQDEIEGSIQPFPAPDSDLEGSIKILLKDAQKELPSNVQVRLNDFEEVDASLEIALKDSTQDVPSELEVQLERFSDVSATVSVRTRVDSDLPSSYFAMYRKESEVESSIYPYSTRSLDGRIEVRRSTESDKEGYIDVEYASKITGSLRVSSGTVPATIVVRESIESDLLSQIEPRRDLRKDLEGTLQPRIREDLGGSLGTQYPSNVDSSIFVRNVADLVGELQTRRDLETSIKGSVIPRVRNISDVDSSISIVSSDLLEGLLKVRRETTEDVEGLVTTVGLTDGSVESTIFVRNVSQLDGELVVRVGAETSLEGHITPRIRNDSVVDSTLIVHQVRAVESSIYVMSRGKDDLQGELSVEVVDIGYSYIL